MFLVEIEIATNGDMLHEVESQAHTQPHTPPHTQPHTQAHIPRLKLDSGLLFTAT